MEKQEFFDCVMSDAPVYICYWAGDMMNDLKTIDGIQTVSFVVDGRIVDADVIENGILKMRDYFKARGKENSNQYIWENLLYYSAADGMGDWDWATYDSNFVDVAIQFALFGKIKYS